MTPDATILPHDATTTESAADRHLAYAGLRLVIGLNMAMHGLVRLINGVGGFAEGMAKGFESTWLPRAMVLPFGYVLPFVELAIGALLILGLKTRETLVASLALIAALIFGMCVQQNWDTVGLQMIYAVVFAALLFLRRWNALSVDGLSQR